MAASTPADRDEIIHTGRLAEDGYRASTSRLSGHYAAIPDEGIHRVSGSYLLGDHETPEIARARLTERLKRQALEQAGQYHALEERLTQDQKLSFMTVALSGSLLEVVSTREELRADGNGRAELVMEADVAVDASGLRRHIDALYDNHALRAANRRLQRENLELRSGRSEGAGPSPRVGSSRARVMSSGDSERQHPAMLTPLTSHRFASELAPWLKDSNLLYAGDWVQAFAESRNGSQLTYQPEGAKALPQDADSLHQLRASTLRPMVSLMDGYSEALTTHIVSRTPHATGTEFVVEVSGFEGFEEALLGATGLPFRQAELLPEQIQNLDPWSSLVYWVVADALVRKPVVLTLRLHGDVAAPGRDTRMAEFHQLMLAPVVFSTDAKTASPLAFTPLEGFLWYLGGKHLPGMGLKAPLVPYEIDGMRHPSSTIVTYDQAFRRLSGDDIQALRAGDADATPAFYREAREAFEVLEYSPKKGVARFRFIAPEGHPDVTIVEGVIQQQPAEVLFPLDRWAGRDDPRSRFSSADAHVKRNSRFF